MARKLKDLTILELLDEWWNEIKEIYKDKPIIRVFDRDRKRLVAIDKELGKKLGVPGFVENGTNLHKPFHRGQNPDEILNLNKVIEGA